MSKTPPYVGHAGTALLAAALLLPVGDAPWFSFWREWAAALAVLLIVLDGASRLRAAGRSLHIPLLSLPTMCLGLAAVAIVQCTVGTVPFHGDALIVASEFTAFALCMGIAQSLDADDRAMLADRMATALLIAALVSVPIAIGQWLGWLTLDLGIHVAAGRPVAHMEQTNLLCTLEILGALGAWRLAERGKLPRRALWLIQPSLLAVMVLTQSRVALLAGGAIVLACLWRRRALAMPPRAAWLVVLAVCSVLVGMLLLPLLDQHLGLTGATLQERTSAGRRPLLWKMMIEAVLQHPWAGWGALQNGAAQYALAPGYPSLAWSFSSAHDLPLDVMLWFGAPLGLLASATLGLAALRRLAIANSLPAFITMLSVLALLLHALVELPLHYLYFSLPLALMLGSSAGGNDDEANAAASRRFALRLPLKTKPVLPLLATAPALLLAALAHEYIALSDVRPLLDIDPASNHLVLGAQAPVPEVQLLDQLQAFHRFAAVPMQAGVSAAELDAMRAPMLRFTFAPSIERYAHVMALNGRRDQAMEALARLCKFQTEVQCEGAEDAWATWQELGQPLPDWLSDIQCGTCAGRARNGQGSR